LEKGEALLEDYLVDEIIDEIAVASNVSELIEVGKKACGKPNAWWRTLMKKAMELDGWGEEGCAGLLEEAFMCEPSPLVPDYAFDGCAEMLKLRAAKLLSRVLRASVLGEDAELPDSTAEKTLLLRLVCAVGEVLPSGGGAGYS
jgi:hypothetical protein